MPNIELYVTAQRQACRQRNDSMLEGARQRVRTYPWVDMRAMLMQRSVTTSVGCLVL